MEFGYFTLSRQSLRKQHAHGQPVRADITDEALYADQLGMHSAWIGEHHFNSLGVLSCPDSCWPISRRAPSTSALRRP